jgi:hypothetical protein
MNDKSGFMYYYPRVHPESGNRDVPSNDNVSSKTEEKTGAPLPASTEAGASPQLTKEEQWALFEKELKENDWGHQPC